MLKIIEDQLTYKDRYNINVYLGSHTSDGGESYFVMSKNGNFNSQSHSASGCFAAHTNSKFSVSGNVVSVKFSGTNFPRTTISDIDLGKHGDLSYIDGCSNSIIIPPPRNGDPCINYLYFPPGIVQTQHTHPSIRIGFVLSGEGIAHTGDTKTKLLPGSVFLLNRHSLHNFSTDVNSHMSLVVFHPDSDSGPTDEFNPMKTRTYIQK